MQPVQIGNCTLYQGDSLEVLPHLPPVDTVMTDPVWPNCPPELLAGWDAPQQLLQSALERITTRRLVIVLRSDSDPRFLSAVPAALPFFRIQILPYVMPGYIGRKLGGDEMAYSFGEPIPVRPGFRVIGGYGPKVQPAERPRNGHPCSRSQKHFNWLVECWSVEGETILDPFMGSGTTGVACAVMGRKFIGCEIEPKYFDIACKRIEDAYRQADLFI